MGAQLFWVSKFKKDITEHFVPFLTGVLLLYIILAFLLVVAVSGIPNKVMMLFFAFIPFSIGKLVTYKKVFIYSLVQIMFVLLSVGFVFFLMR